jgi:hypothetical protein
MAHELVQWLLDYSRRCVNAGQYTGALLPGQTDEDRGPWSCHRFALRAMLPFGPVSPMVNERVEKVLNIGLDQIMCELVRRWRYLPDKNACLELLAKHWLVELIERLKLMLSEIPRQQEWGYIADAIASCFGGMESAAAENVVTDTLVPCLDKPGYKHAWGRIAYAIGSGFERMESNAVQEVVADTLVPRLDKADYDDAWEDIVAAIGSGFERMESAAAEKLVVDALVPRLDKPDYKGAWWHIADAIGSGFQRMESAAAEKLVVDTLVPRLDKPAYKDAWEDIAAAIGSGFERMESAAVQRVVADTLVPCLDKPDYEDAWRRIVNAIGRGFERMESAAIQKLVADTLVPCLGRRDHKDAWRSIAGAIGRGFERMENAAAEKVVVDTLAPYLDKHNLKDVWWYIAIAIGSGFARMESAAVQKVVADTLVPRLGKSDYKCAWGDIAAAIGSGFERMESAAVQKVVADMLVPCLGEPDYEDAWGDIAGAIGRGLERMESIAVKTVVADKLVPCMDTLAYKGAWWHIAGAIGRGFERMESTAVKTVVADTLVPSLDKADYEDAWEDIATIIANCGHLFTGKDAPQFDRVLARTSRTSHLFTIVDSAPQLRWFVRRIADDQQPKRIIYGVCGRNDPELLFDPELQSECAPPVSQTQQPAAVGRSGVPANASPKRTGKGSLPNGRIGTPQVRELVRQIAATLGYDTSTLAIIVEWTRSKNGTDMMDGALEIANAVSPDEPAIVRHTDPENNRISIDSAELVTRLSNKAAKKLLAARAAEWAGRSKVDPRSVSDEDMKNMGSICPGCGCIDKQVRPEKRGESRVRSPCRCCGWEFSEEAITEWPEMCKTCEASDCAVAKSNVRFAYPPPPEGWRKRKKEYCPQCRMPLSRAMKFDSQKL